MTELLWDQFLKNLVTISPTKGEAKKTVSRGIVRLRIVVESARLIRIEGMATDDIVSIDQWMLMDLDQAQLVMTPALLSEAMRTDFVGWWTTDELKSGKLHYPTTEFDPDFDKRFWIEHVHSSIHDLTQGVVAQLFSFNPDRMRKLALIEPRGQEMTMVFCEWADRTIIRWGTLDEIHGVYAPTGVL